MSRVCSAGVRPGRCGRGSVPTSDCNDLSGLDSVNRFPHIPTAASGHAEGEEKGGEEVMGGDFLALFFFLFTRLLGGARPRPPVRPQHALKYYNTKVLFSTN